MSSREADPGAARADEIDVFLAEHGLSSVLEEPLRALLRRAVSRAETIVRVAEPSPPTLMLAYYDGEGPAPETLPSLVGRLSTDEEEMLPPEPPRSVVRLGLLGRGGMAEVHRARDLSLDRILAMKLLHDRFRSDPKMRARFLAEAQVTAQLSHPSIPPVHAVGIEDGLPYFTMKEVRGRTLSDVIVEMHQGVPGSHGWTEARLLDVFQKVCEAVAYAHARGVIHCDLKPSNVMVGAFGEVLVMDWGVARLVEPARTQSSDEPRVEIAWAPNTTQSEVAGTPAYMPPEQAVGEVDRLGPHSDVFALGVMLYETLAGRRPYSGTPVQLLMQSSKGVIPDIEPRMGSSIDEALVAVVHRAMAPKPEDRYPDAAALASDVARWREGSLRREKALAVVRQAQAMLPEVGPKRERARLLRELAEQRLALLGPDASAEAKGSAWTLQDEAATLERDAHMRILEVEQKLHGALAHAPDLREANDLLARIHLERHEDAERRRAADEAARHEVLLRAHDVGPYAGYLAGVSTLTIVTEPACRVRLYRFVERGRQLVPELVRELGHTPLVDVEVPIGSYVLELDAGDRPVVRYPVILRRTEPWTGRPPGASEALPIRLPEASELGPDDVYVPAGWFVFGGDDLAPGAGPARRVWVDAYVIQRKPVQTRDLFRYLAHADAEGARRGLLRSGVSVFRPDWPVCGVPWDAARSYAEWFAARTSLPWRLPTELEWEKAARGVDGRWFPWGDVLDGAFAHVRFGERTPRAPRSVDAFDRDRSPYGVLGMGGNVRDWCVDPWLPEGPPSMAGLRAVGLEPGVAERRAVRGGSWRLPADTARVASRAGATGHMGHADIGVRLVRSLG